MAIDVVVREELAWAAGFFDGEGNTNAFRHGRTWQLQLSVMQLHQDTLIRLKAVLGVGTVYGPYQNGQQPNPLYHFKVRGFERVQAVIAMLWPWLTPHKRQQAIIALNRFKETYRPPRISQHGTHSHYVSHKCRCNSCIEAHREYGREWARKHRKKVRDGS